MGAHKQKEVNEGPIVFKEEKNLKSSQVRKANIFLYFGKTVNSKRNPMGTRIQSSTIRVMV